MEVHNITVDISSIFIAFNVILNIIISATFNNYTRVKYILFTIVTFITFIVMSYISLCYL